MHLKKLLKITIITKCSGEPSWRYISIDNPQKNINESFNISSQHSDQPWSILSKLFPILKSSTKNILEKLDKDFFDRNFKSQGTMIILEGLHIANFNKFYSTDEYARDDWSYLKHYIRFNTRHGDMRILRPDKTGFPQRKEALFKGSMGYNDQCKLFLWSKTKKEYTLEEIESGYPYLQKPNDNEEIKISTPAEVSSLENGNFSGRYCSTFKYQETIYCITLAIDGNRRALNNYKELGRQGKDNSKSGIRLVDQRGTFISSEGVKICSYNKIFEHFLLEKYSILAENKVQRHYILIINGSFNVVTNRNSLTDTSKQILENNSFIEKIKNFLDEAERNVDVFRELIERLNKENQEKKLEKDTERLNKLKESIQYRPRFKVNNIEQLKDKWIIAPEHGEEHWVGALYTMFSHLVTVNSPCQKLWVRPRTFCGNGLDSIAVPLEVNSLKETAHVGLEYKYTFSATDDYNHPFIVIGFMVCWDMLILEEGEKIHDAYEYFGSVSLKEELIDIGYEIVNIQSQTGEIHNQDIQVISLSKLLDKTFDCEWTTPPK